jgi:hypothetical protein
MSIDVVHILPTNKTPEIFLHPDGIIKIKGRAIDESRTKFSEQIMTWIDSYLLNPPKTTEVTIVLEYLNSFNSIIVASVIKKLFLVTMQSKQLVIKWYIDKDDDDMLERGNYISSTFRIPIEFILIDDVKTMF